MTGETVLLDGPVMSVRMDALGARLSSIRHKATSREILSASDISVTSRARVRTEAEWLQRFASGWNVLIPHAGDARRVDGVDHEFHGEAPRRFWDVTRTEESLTATVRLRSAPFTLTRSVGFEGSGLVVRQRIVNETGERRRFAWVEHPVFDGAIFAGVDEITLGSGTVPVAVLGQGSFHSAPVASGRLSVPLVSAGLVLRLQWDPIVLPHCHIWQERRSEMGSPWFGRVDGIALEPASHGSGVAKVGLGPLELEPYGTIESSIRLEIAASA